MIKKKPKKGITLDECVERARDYIAEQGSCIFLGDIQGSKKYSREEAVLNKKIFIKAVDELNALYSGYFIGSPYLYPPGRGIEILFGDAFGAEINSAEPIPLIAEYIEENMPGVSFWWYVGKDWRDKDVKEFA